MDGSYLNPLFDSDDDVRKILMEYNTEYMDFMKTAEVVSQGTPNARMREAAIGEVRRFGQAFFTSEKEENVLTVARDEILTGGSPAVEEILRAGNISLFLADFYTAYLCFSEAMALHIPLSPAQCYLVSIVLTHFQAWDTLISILSPVLGELNYPYSSDAYFRLGIAYKKTRMYVKALEQFRECAARPPSWIHDHDIMVEISQIYFLQGNIKAAFQQIHPYLRTPSTVQQIVFLCLCSDEIETGLRTVTEFESTTYSTELRYLKGRLFYKRGNIQEAFVQLRSVVEMDTTNALAWCALGNIYMRMNQLDDAIACYRKAIVSDNDMTEAWMNLICCCDLDPLLREQNRRFVESFPSPPVNTEPRRRKRDEPAVPIIIEPNDRDRFPAASDLIEDIFCNEVPRFSTEVMQNIDLLTAKEEEQIEADTKDELVQMEEEESTTENDSEDAKSSV